MMFAKLHCFNVHITYKDSKFKDVYEVFAVVLPAVIKAVIKLELTC